MAETYSTLAALFTDIADAIREKTGETASIVADDFPDMIRERLQAIPFYLTFSSPSSFTLRVNDATKHWDGTLEYSTDKRTWTVWDGTTMLSSRISGSENVLYLRGTSNTVITGSFDEELEDYGWGLTGSDISCIGNIETLLDYATVESGNHPTMEYYCYYYMFANCTALTQAPALPATTLAWYCYNNMFADCTALTQAPALPATTLANNCYGEMFRGCTSLTQAPALPATKLVDLCYALMFLGCTALTQAPALPATTLANNCYGYMFSGCTSLTQVPALPATTLAKSCYNGMFQDCTSLTKAPALPATTLAPHCYNDMFYGCTSLTQVPALPATTLADYCYYYMFRGCTKIKLSATKTGEYMVEYRIPTTGTGTTATDALTYMFTSTGGTFTGTPEINTTYYLSNTNTVVIPPPIPYLTFSSPNSFTLKVNDATKHWDGTLEYSTDASTWSTWDGTTTLSSATSGSKNILYLRGTGNTVITGNDQNYKWVLTGADVACIGNIENLLDYATVEAGQHPTMKSTCYMGMFSGCTALTQTPALPATTLKTQCYQSMFNGCTSLTQAPTLPATTLAEYCYASMFQGCTALTQAPALPATTLANVCYSDMFSGCTSLIQAPALPATTLANVCYAGMFNGCTSLKLSSTKTGEYTQEYRIPSSGAGTTATNALIVMFASTGGTFTGTPEINTTYYLSNTNTVV